MLRVRFLCRAFLAIAVLLMPGFASAQFFYDVTCTGLFGCGNPMEDVLMMNTLPTAAAVLIQLAAGGAVIAVVIGGVQMVLSYADDGKISNARKAIMYALGGLALALAAAPIVTFVSTEEYGQSSMGSDFLFGPFGIMAAAIRIIMLLFNVAFAIVIIVAGIRMVVSAGNADEFKKAGSMIKWSIVGSVLVTAARAAVQALLVLNL